MGNVGNLKGYPSFSTECHYQQSSTLSIGDTSVKKIDRFVIWICSKFTRSDIEHIIQGLSDILANRNPDVKPKDDFKEKHPNYRNFFVDPKAPLTTPPQSKPKLNWRNLLAEYKKKRQSSKTR